MRVVGTPLTGRRAGGGTGGDRSQNRWRHFHVALIGQVVAALEEVVGGGTDRMRIYRWWHEALPKVSRWRRNWAEVEGIMRWQAGGTCQRPRARRAGGGSIR